MCTICKSVDNSCLRYFVHICYYYTMPRPLPNEARLMGIRNSLILQCIESGVLNQTEVAIVFRLPRNTVSMIKRKNGKK